MMTTLLVCLKQVINKTISLYYKMQLGSLKVERAAPSRQWSSPTRQRIFAAPQARCNTLKFHHLK
jgi:hypothetical protein